jgi:pantoate kinase
MFKARVLTKGYGVHIPGNISCFFRPYPNGSAGCGINTDKGVFTSVSMGSGITINGKGGPANTSRIVLEKYNAEGKLSVNHSTEVPISYGFGTSASGALGLSVCLNAYLKANKSWEDVVRIAYEADMEAKTGLGDVIGLANMEGVGLKTKPGMEGLKPENRVKVKTPEWVICGLFKGGLETKKVLTNPALMEKIKKTGETCVKDLAKAPTYENLVRISRFFTKETGLWNADIKRAMEKIHDCSMIMLGHGVYCLTDEPEKKAEAMGALTEKIVTCKIVQI